MTSGMPVDGDAVQAGESRTSGPAETSDQLPSNESVIGRLLEEISWEKATAYRSGGRGRENVLTAEILQPLDYLPREAFLGSVIRAANGADEARVAVADEIESATVTLLPQEITVGTTPGVAVQPDGFISADRSLVLIEAKRIRSSTFQTEQLAREYIALHQAAGDRTPLLLLILGSAPPFLVQKRGRIGFEESIAAELDSVLARQPAITQSREQLLADIPNVVAWTTWADINAVVQRQADVVCGTLQDASVRATVRRLCAAVSAAFEWHS